MGSVRCDTATHMASNNIRRDTRGTSTGGVGVIFANKTSVIAVVDVFLLGLLSLLFFSSFLFGSAALLSVVAVL